MGKPRRFTHLALDIGSNFEYHMTRALQVIKAFGIIISTLKLQIKKQEWNAEQGYRPPCNMIAKHDV